MEPEIFPLVDVIRLLFRNPHLGLTPMRVGLAMRRTSSEEMKTLGQKYINSAMVGLHFHKSKRVYPGAK